MLACPTLHSGTAPFLAVAPLTEAVGEPPAMPLVMQGGAEAQPDGAALFDPAPLAEGVISPLTHVAGVFGPGAVAVSTDPEGGGVVVPGAPSSVLHADDPEVGEYQHALAFGAATSSAPDSRTMLPLMRAARSKRCNGER